MNLTLATDVTTVKMTILNCLLARQLCFEDSACTAILEIIPRVCGSELVACSTVTVTKCQAALRTLRAFPFFMPTCLCREPSVDPECNSFRDFLFDHPCNNIKEKEKDPYPVETLPTCNYALSVCHDEKPCSVLFDRFKNACKTRDGECRMDDREACREAWSGLRLSPLFGCICPNTHMKKRCERIFAIVNHNPCVERIGKENGKASDDTKVALQSTCHTALDTCIKDSECVASLTPVLQKCHASDCDREGCMAALRTFYRQPGVHWNTEIAFCLCKKTENKEDSCMNAQERLHPSCAQRPPVGATLPACHTLAAKCREDKSCKIRLQNYEQWCAVDSITQGCAGSPAACRAAVVALLGTQLRATCACRGTDFGQLYDCLGWQRLLWLNPCVVEAQSDYHIKTYGTPTTPTPYDTVKYITIAPESPIYHRTTTHHHHTTQHVAQIIIPEPEVMSPITTMSEQTVGPNDIGQISEPEVIVIETTTEVVTTTTQAPTTTTTTVATTTTTRRPTTTREPAKYCIVKKPEMEDEYIKMGETKRLYRSAEQAECTDLCFCEPTLQVSCKVACVPRAPCSSRLAHYSHAAPAYQAYRGRCYCYSGSFICMRPNPGEYKLPEGVYLLLGFSSLDESLLRPHTGLGAEDAVRMLQTYLLTVEEMSNCTLTLFNISKDNLIISASIPPREQEHLKDAGEPLLDKEKEECIDVLKVVKARINSQHEDISSHNLLSIFKIAEVDVVYPTPPSSSAHGLPNNKLVLLIIFTTFITNIHHLITLIIITATSLKATVNTLTNLLDKIKRYSSNILLTIPCFGDDYFVKTNAFINLLTLVKGILVSRKHTSAHASRNDALVDVNVTELNVSIEFNVMKHIIQAVRSTICSLNSVLVAVIVTKYFCSDVFNGIGISIDWVKLNDFDSVASMSWMSKSVSLGLIAVV